VLQPKSTRARTRRRAPRRRGQRQRRQPRHRNSRLTGAWYPEPTGPAPATARANVLPRTSRPPTLQVWESTDFSFRSTTWS